MQAVHERSGVHGHAQAHAPRLGHAVIIGGSFAGLLAARALWRVAERITLIERDLPAAELMSPRKGVPQGQHAHVLLNSGLTCLREFFPDLDQDLRSHAGAPFDLMAQTRWRIEGRFRPRFASPYRAYAIGRPALEALVRKRVAALEGVTFAAGRSVAGLRFDRDRVTGVELADGEILPADLVIDASGRGTRTPRWLKDAGFEAPLSQSLDLGLTYTSFVLEPDRAARSSAHGDRDFRMLLLPPQLPHAPHGGLITPLEHGRYLATLVSYGKERPPLDWEDFRRFAACVGDASFARLLAEGRPVGSASAFAIPSQEWRRYDRCHALPRRLLVLGDALCSFDPAFGQGISVSALEARLLDRLLRDPGLALDQLGSAFFAQTAPIIATPWGMSRGSRSDSESTARPSLVSTLMRRYRSALLRAAATSPALHLAFARVVHLEAKPASLLAPRVIARVLLAQLRPDTRRPLQLGEVAQ